MKTPYRTADGKIVLIEAEPEAVEQLDKFKRQDKSARRKARRHNEASIDEMHERTGWQPADTTVNIEAEYEQREEKEMLIAAITLLSERQQRLVRLYYYENKTEADIAREFGVSQQAVNQQLATVHKALKKYFGKFLN